MHLWLQSCILFILHLDQFLNIYVDTLIHRRTLHNSYYQYCSLSLSLATAPTFNPTPTPRKTAKYLAMASCYEKQKACVGWINKYFDDCVCNLSGEISFGLGMISLFCWGMAEIPQLITNFQTKSGHGVSLALLLTWVIG